MLQPLVAHGSGATAGMSEDNCLPRQRPSARSWARYREARNDTAQGGGINGRPRVLSIAFRLVLFSSNIRHTGHHERTLRCGHVAGVSMCGQRRGPRRKMIVAEVTSVDARPSWRFSRSVRKWGYQESAVRTAKRRRTRDAACQTLSYRELRDHACSYVAGQGAGSLARRGCCATAQSKCSLSSSTLSTLSGHGSARSQEADQSWFSASTRVLGERAQQQKQKRRQQPKRRGRNGAVSDDGSGSSEQSPGTGTAHPGRGGHGGPRGPGSRGVGIDIDLVDSRPSSRPKRGKNLVGKCLDQGAMERAAHLRGTARGKRGDLTGGCPAGGGGVGSSREHPHVVHGKGPDYRRVSTRPVLA